jgi:hypothetical protein
LPYKLTVPREFYEDIGHALCQWAHFEQSVNEWLFEVVTDGKTQGELRKAAFHRRLDKLLGTVAPQIEHRLRSNYFNRFRQQCEALKKTRDAIAHGFLGVDDEDGGVVLFRYNYAVLMEVCDVDARRMERLVSRLSILNNRLLRMKQLYKRPNL